MPRKSRYISTDVASCLHINPLTQKVKNHLISSKAADKADQEGLKDIMYKHLTEMLIDDQKLTFSFKKNHLGGYRWFAMCPKCNTKAVKLFKPDRMPDKEQKYLCAKCHGLKSPSALYGDAKKYHEVIRPLKRMSRIVEVLRTSRKLSEEETRKLMTEHEELRTLLAASVVYQRLKLQLDSEGLLKDINFLPESLPVK